MLLFTGTQRTGAHPGKLSAQEGIPYVVWGGEDFLLDSKVRGALYFFRYVLHPEDTMSREMALKQIWESTEGMQKNN